MNKFLSIALGMALSISFANAQKKDKKEKEPKPVVQKEQKVEKREPKVAKEAKAAPELLSKKGLPILPEAGEWGLGISANPFLQYLGNVASGSTTTNTAPGFMFPVNPTNNGFAAGTMNPTNSVALFGKYFKDAQTAYRVRFNYGTASNTNKVVVNQDQVTPDPYSPAFCEDWQRTRTTNLILGLGIEKRRGSTRLQGIYGAELVLGYSNRTDVYEYGNPITVNFNNPTSHDFGNNLTPGGRITEQKYGAGFFMGARGFVGVEYFFAPKMSIGGEFGYTLGVAKQGRGLITSESWDGASNSVRTVKTDVYNNGLTNVGLGLDNLNGAINLMFYF